VTLSLAAVLAPNNDIYAPHAWRGIKTQSGRHSHQSVGGVGSRGINTNIRIAFEPIDVVVTGQDVHLSICEAERVMAAFCALIETPLEFGARCIQVHVYDYSVMASAEMLQLFAGTEPVDNDTVNVRGRLELSTCGIEHPTMVCLPVHLRCERLQASHPGITAALNRLIPQYATALDEQIAELIS
jgi:hypothetical protein